MSRGISSEPSLQVCQLLCSLTKCNMSTYIATFLILVLEWRDLKVFHVLDKKVCEITKVV